MFDLVLKNGEVFTGETFIKSDLAIEGEKISAIGLDLKGKQELDVSHNWILPGAIDAHTHFSLPFYNSVASDDFYTGSRAGAAGGVTTFIDFTAQENNEGILSSLKRRLEESKPSALDYSLHACIAKFNSTVADEIKYLPEFGIRSFKIFTAYNKIGRMQNDENLYRIMELCKLNDIMVTVHAENGLVIDYLTDVATKNNDVGMTALRRTRPVFTETEAISRVCNFAKFTDCKTHIVHISSGDGANALKIGKSSGAPVTGETCPHYMYLDDSCFEKDNGHYWSCCPPIRPIGQQENLWTSLENGTIAMVATDHCPFRKQDKNTWEGSINKIPMGLPGIETMAPLVLNGIHSKKLSIISAIKAISENPAKIFGLYPQKGSLIPGTDADIMVYNPREDVVISQNNLMTNNDYSIYEGLQIRGRNEMTILRGKIIYSNKQGWIGTKGSGKFLKRNSPDEKFFK